MCRNMPGRWRGYEGWEGLQGVGGMLVVNPTSVPPLVRGLIVGVDCYSGFSIVLYVHT